MAPKLGATNRFPFGKISEDDEGELQLAIAADPFEGVVKLMFGKPVAWLGLPSGTARALASLLIEKADDLDKMKS